MDLPTMIRECSTLAQLTELEEKFSLSELDKNLIFKRRLSILVRLVDWSIENEALVLLGNFPAKITFEKMKNFWITALTLTIVYKNNSERQGPIP